MAPIDDMRGVPSISGATGLRAPTLTGTARDTVRARKLLRAAQHSDRGARERLVVTHLGLVRRIASRYRELGVPLDDLVQEGSLGLLDAIDRFDPSRGVGFEAYARFRVRRAIRNALTDQARLVRLPKLVVERRRMLARTESSLTAAANGRTPTPAELAAATGLSLAAVLEARTAAINPVSFDDPTLADGPTLESVVGDCNALDPELETLEREEATLLEAAVERLPTRQGQVVRRHFGLDRPAEPIGDVATELHLSPQRARAIERDALFELRATLEVAEVAP